MKRYYFDWAASAPCDKRAAEAVNEALFRYPANPSSIHPAGKDAKRFMEECRQRCADCFQVSPKRIIFTSGGSESNNIVISSFLRKRKPVHVLSSPIEHPSVINPLFELKNAGHKIEWIRINPDGKISVEDLNRKLTPQTALICLIHTHNESGSFQPVAEAVSIVRSFEKKHSIRIHVHCDAVQSAGKSPCDWIRADADSASVSAHKFGGPRGIGILYLKKTILPLYCGGGQESGMRPGTENLPGIAGMTAALEERTEHRNEETAAAESLKKLITEAFSEIPEMVIPLAELRATSPYLLQAAVPGIPSEVFQRMLGDRGFDISSGSACSSNAAVNRQKIKNPFGLDEKIEKSLLRFSWGHLTTREEALMLIRAVREVIHENKILLR